LNFPTDLCALLVSTLVATALSHRSIRADLGQVISTAAAAMGIWTVALRYYESWAFEREAVEDAALTSVLALAVTVFWAVINLVLPEDAALPGVAPFLLVFWPLVLALRLLVFRGLFDRGSSLGEVLIIGIGPMGQLTEEEISRRGRQRVVGCLGFHDQSRSGSLRSRFLGTADDLEVVLRTTPVSEVYIAGDVWKHSDAMQAAVATGCRKGDRRRLLALSSGGVEATSDGGQTFVRHRGFLGGAGVAPAPVRHHSAGDQGHFARACFLPPSSGGPARPAFPNAQVPLHGRERGGTAAIAAQSE
jgi:FlaA1/EpsC-like NDP-sugar epimerase